jgi:hypothetical protein
MRRNVIAFIHFPIYRSNFGESSALRPSYRGIAVLPTSACVGASVVTGASMPSVEPDMRWVPSESHSAGEFSELRDLTPCFPEVEKQLIHLETAEGQQIASDDIATLRLKERRIGDVTFQILWAGFDRTNRMLKAGDASREEFQLIYMAYDRIAGHICATRCVEYEEARVSRYIKYLDGLDRVTDPARYSIRNSDFEAPLRRIWTQQDMEDGEAAELLRLQHVAQRDEADRKQAEERCRFYDAQRAERYRYYKAQRAERYRQAVTQRAGPSESPRETGAVGTVALVVGGE